jgi:hypothetical protein
MEVRCVSERSRRWSDDPLEYELVPHDVADVKHGLARLWLLISVVSRRGLWASISFVSVSIEANLILMLFDDGEDN